ncbi:MAG: DUF4908 domain-containing protein [Proteobacteria bacterium]|nr:DUF4908 domain-containing protein [Pseudomonadota bacterium]
MTAKPKASFRRCAAAGLAGACASLLVALAPPAYAGPLDSLRHGLLGRHPSDGRQSALPPVGRYVSEDGDVFTLDRTQPKPLMKFENSGEVWVLSPQPAPRGDTIFKNEVGEPLLRATRLGGMTLFTEHRPEGEAAAFLGPASPIRVMVLSPQALTYRLLQASLHVGHVLHHTVVFEAEDVSPASSGIVADAAMVTTLAVDRSADKAEAQGFLTRLRRVFLTEGRKSSAQFDVSGTLTITVAPGLGIAGRPSSGRIEQVAQTFR